MDHRKKSESRWDDLAKVLRRMRDGRDFSLAEAQRCFAAAPDRPFSARALQAMVVAAIAGGSENRSSDEALAELVFASDINAAAGGPMIETNVCAEGGAFLEGFVSELCDIVGWHPSTVADGWITDVDSTAVDTRGVRWTRLPLELRGSNIDPIVLDVGAGFDELTAVAFRKTREATAREATAREATARDGRYHDLAVRSDVCLGTAESAMLDYAVVCTTSFDFGDYDDEVIEELLRN